MSEARLQRVGKGVNCETKGCETKDLGECWGELKQGRQCMNQNTVKQDFYFSCIEF